MPKMYVSKDELWPFFSCDLQPEGYTIEIFLEEKELDSLRKANEEFFKWQDILREKAETEIKKKKESPG